MGVKEKRQANTLLTVMDKAHDKAHFIKGNGGNPKGAGGKSVPLGARIRV